MICSLIRIRWIIKTYEKIDYNKKIYFLHFKNIVA
jgi:hypothetical protein